MSSPLSYSRRGCHQKLCVVLLLFSTLLHLLPVVHARRGKKPKGGSSPKKLSPEKAPPKVGKDKGKKDEFKDGTYKKDEFKDKTYKKVKESSREFHKPDKKMSKKEEKKLEEEMTFMEFEYDLTFFDTDHLFEKDETKIIADAFRSTYNDMFTDFVVVKATAGEQTMLTEEGANRHLLLRSSRLRMRLRATGSNILARRDLIRTQVNRLLLPSGVRGMIGKTVNEEDEASHFIEAFNAKFVDASEYGILQPVHSDIPTQVDKIESHRKVTEILFPFETSLTYNNVDGKLPLEAEREAKENFKKAYNLVFNTSLVVSVKTVSQELISNDGTLDLVFTFTGTCYTDDEVATGKRFDQIDSMAAQEAADDMDVASENHFFEMFGIIEPDSNNN